MTSASGRVFTIRPDGARTPDNRRWPSYGSTACGIDAGYADGHAIAARNRWSPSRIRPGSLLPTPYPGFAALCDALPGPMAREARCRADCQSRSLSFCPAWRRTRPQGPDRWQGCCASRRAQWPHWSTGWPAAGLVVRIGGIADRRTAELDLTAAGHAVVSEWQEVNSRILAAALTALRAASRRSLELVTAGLARAHQRGRCTRGRRAARRPANTRT